MIVYLHPLLKKSEKGRIAQLVQRIPISNREGQRFDSFLY